MYSWGDLEMVNVANDTTKARKKYICGNVVRHAVKQVGKAKWRKIFQQTSQVGKKHGQESFHMRRGSVMLWTLICAFNSLTQLS